MKPKILKMKLIFSFTLHFKANIIYCKEHGNEIKWVVTTPWEVIIITELYYLFWSTSHYNQLLILHIKQY